MITKLSPPSHIAEGSRVRGDLYFFSEAEVFGTVEGNIRQESLEPVSIGQFGWIHGNVKSTGPIIISGRVDGEVSSDTQVRILPTARIEGNVRAPSIEIRSGAVVNGTFDTERVSTTSLKKAA
ncbi:MAG: polymer-forming cytoskeletal protein [Deltaproteobacteria bacterium]|nr:polymer-forming cytoskeletal protein [Deltaproteobacteria bacterium]MBI3295666.1 polymer-forming cytoskeletal protein [Deltaproteobacteria bacterium]